MPANLRPGRVVSTTLLPTDFRYFTGLEVPDPITFVLSPDWLDRPNLYPRQATLLKVIFLREDLMTDYDFKVIADWEESFRRSGNNGIVPNILDRMALLRDMGYSHFREVLLVLGRRAGKGYVCALAMAYVLWRYMSLGDPQDFYGVDRDKQLACFIFAGKKEQARENLYKDLVNVILGAPCYSPYISRPMGESLSIYAPNDFVRMRKRQLRGISTAADQATFTIQPKEATLMSGRGPASFMQGYDEMAHQVSAGGASRSAEEVYCLDPMTQVLCADLTWRPLHALQPGDELVGFDEHHPPGHRRKLRTTTIKHKWSTWGRALRLHFDDGSSVVCSPNHRWLVEHTKGSSWVRSGDAEPGGAHAEVRQEVRAGFDAGKPVPDLAVTFNISQHRIRELLKQTGVVLPGGRQSKKNDLFPQAEALLDQGYSLAQVATRSGIPYQTLLRWCREEGLDPGTNGPKRNHLRAGDRIRHLVDPWTILEGRDAGWLAGIYDGEGCIDRASSMSRSAYRVGVSQNEGIVLDKIERLLGDFGFGYRHYLPHPSTDSKAHALEVFGLGNCLRLLGSLRPDRLLSYNQELWEGRSPRGQGGRTEFKTVTNIEELPEQELVDIETTTSTFIAEGLFSHNSAATPALDQFKKDAFIVEPSSPWQMIGQFYENWEHTLEVGPDGEPTYPEMMMLQLASWEIYYDWEIAHQFPVFPKGFEGDLGEYVKQSHPRFGRLRGAIQEYDEAMQRLEKANPETFGVERLSHWQATVDAYLDPKMIDKMWLPWNGETLQMKTEGVLSLYYKGHADPSLANANFGVAIAHPEVDDKGFTHCVFDFIGHWQPSDFEGNIIDYVEIEENLWRLINGFKPDEFTFDQWNSASVIAQLKKRVYEARFPKRVQVWEQTATVKHNFARAENFKISLNQEWIHAPFYELTALELRFLQLKNGKVEKQDTGPVVTKDTADCLMECVWAILGDQVNAFIGGKLSQFPMSGSVPGGIDPHMRQQDRPDVMNQLAGFGRATGRDMVTRSGARNPARSANRGGRRR